MTRPTHSHKPWTDKGGHVTLSPLAWLGVVHLDGYGAVFGIDSLLIVSLVIAVSLLPVRVVRR